MFDENWDTVQVFMQCQPSYLQGGLGKPVYVGVSAMEIEAAARLCQIRAEDYETLRAGVRVMVSETAEIRR